MKKKVLFLAFSIVISFFSQKDIFAGEKDVIWITADFPPFSIVSGPYKNQGILNFIRDKVKKALQNYEFVTQVANPKRTFHELRRQDRMIYATAAKTAEREKYVLFSVPYAIVLKHNLIILKKNISSIKPYLDDNEFLFEKALSESRLIFGYSIGRQYGEKLNKAINEYNKKGNLRVYYRNYFKDSFVDLLNGGIDCVIGLPNESEYFMKILRSNEKVVLYPFRGEEKFFTGYFVLPKTKWGEDTLKIINRVLLKYRNSEEFHKNYEKWLSKKSRKLYRKYVREFYKNS